MNKYRKKPVVIEAIQIEAIQYDGTKENIAAICRLGNNIGLLPDGIIIKILEGNMIAFLNDWIIKGIQGEFYPCKSDIFEATYEAVEE